MGKWKIAIFDWNNRLSWINGDFLPKSQIFQTTVYLSPSCSPGVGFPLEFCNGLGLKKLEGRHYQQSWEWVSGSWVIGQIGQQILVGHVTHVRHPWPADSWSWPEIVLARFSRDNWVADRRRVSGLSLFFQCRRSAVGIDWQQVWFIFSKQVSWDSSFLMFSSLFRRFISHRCHHGKSHFTVYSAGIPRDFLVHGNQQRQPKLLFRLLVHLCFMFILYFSLLATNQ